MKRFNITTSLCKNCNKEFSHSVLKNPKANKYCSRECSKSYTFEATCRVCGILFTSRGIRILCSNECRKKDDRNRARIWGKTRPKIQKQNKKCEICLKSFIGYEKGKYCSKTCLNRSKTTMGHNKQRSEKHGVYYDPTVKRIKVLERDNWHCKICGVHTPRTKSGSYDNDAPEMDHIIPFALGGSHSWNNVQCLCRKCNIDKHAKHPDDILT